MKFTGGYLLGVTTVLGMAASFVAGAITMEYIHTQKKTAAEKVADATLSDMLRPFIERNKN